MPNGLPIAIPLRDLELMAGGGLAVTGTLIFFNGVVGAAQPVNLNTLLGGGMVAGGLFLLFDATKRR